MALLGILHILWPRSGPERWLNNVILRESCSDLRHADMSRITAGDWFPPRAGRTDWHRIARRLNYASRLGEIMAPTFIMCGRHDPQYPAACSEEVARGIRSAQLIFVDHSGHFPFVEEPNGSTFNQPIRSLRKSQATASQAVIVRTNRRQRITETTRCSVLVPQSATRCDGLSHDARLPASMRAILIHRWNGSARRA